MNHVVIGVLISMASLLMLYQNHWALGLAAFIAGIIIMNKNRWKR